MTPSVDLCNESWFHMSGDVLHIRWLRLSDMRSGLMTRKSAKYSWTALTTSWSSASARRSKADFFMMLLKSDLVSVRRSLQSYARQLLQMWYSPYLGSRNSSIKNWMLSGDGRTKQRHRRWRIFSRVSLSSRLHCTVSMHLVRLPCRVPRHVLCEIDFMVEKG